MNSQTRRSILCLLLLSVLPLQATARQEPIVPLIPDRDEPVSYFLEILDILDSRCSGCHNTALTENGLNMEEISGLLEGGESGPAIVPASADKSLMYQMAAHLKEPFMPPVEDNLKPMTPEELGLLKLWIDQGARDDTDEVLESMDESETTIELGELPPGINPILALDLNPKAAAVACGRANVVQVYDVLSGIEIVRLGGHRDLIQSIRYSPNGSKLAAGSYQIVTIWDAPTGAQVHTLKGHGDPIHAVAANQDGSLVASISDDKTLRIWKTEDGSEIRQINLPNGSSARSVALGEDGSVVLTGGSDGVVRLWKVDDGSMISEHQVEGGAINALTFVGADQSGIGAGSEDGTIRLWKLEGALNEFGFEAEPEILDGLKEPLVGLASVHTKDGTRIVSAGQDGRLGIWSIGDTVAQLTLVDGEAGPFTSIAASPDGTTILCGTAESGVQLRDANDGHLIRQLDGLSGPIHAVSFGPSGNRVAASSDQGFKIWEPGTGVGVIAFGHVQESDPQNTFPVKALAFLDDGRIVSGGDDKFLKAWEFGGRWAYQETLEPHQFRVLAIDFSPDGTKLATGGGFPSSSGEVTLWDLESGQPLYRLDELHSDTVFSVRFSPDGTKLATTAADKFVKVINPEDGSFLKDFEGHTHHVLDVDWNEDGTQLVSAGADNVLKLWNFEAGEQIRTSQAAGSQITGVSWVAGKPTLYGSSGDSTVRQWNAQNGRIQRTMGEPTDYVFAVDSSNDGSLVVAGGQESVLYFWRGDNGRLIRKIEPPAEKQAADVPAIASTNE